MSLNKNYTDNRDAENNYVPKTPVEKYLAKINGDDIDVPYPNKPLEYQLDRLAKTYPENADILNKAKDTGGIGWVDEDKLLYSGVITQETTVIIKPAKVMLAPGKTYDFRVTINGTPYVVTSRPAQVRGTEVVAEIQAGRNTPAITVGFSLSTNENSLDIYVEELSDPFSISIVAIGETHKISEEYLPEPSESVPTPTIEDEGKVLSVDSSGEYVLTQPSGGGGAFILNATAGVFDTSTSYNDILAAVQAGKLVVMLNKKNASDTQMCYLSAMSTEGGYVVEFDGGSRTYTATTADGALTMME